MSEFKTGSLGKEVAVGDIQKELKKLWEANEANTKASLMNLLVYTENPDDLVRNSESVRELTHEHSFRALLIAMNNKEPEASIRAWLTAHCRVSHGKKLVCCEQIAFLLSGRAVGRLRNTVFSNLSSDLPLVFWWQGELSDHFNIPLYRLFDRLIVDSGAWQNPAIGFAKLATAQENMGGKLILQDLAWARSFHFRMAFAALFDDILAQRALHEINRVRVVAQNNQRTPALLLISWLATQAGWREGQELALHDEKKNENGENFFFETEQGNAVEVELIWDESAASLALLEVCAPTCTIRIERKKGARHLSQFLQAGDHKIELSAPADKDEAIDLLADQLSRGGQSSLYQKALPIFLRLL